jgi:capsule polysaccharide export protein KpsE/RkpR
MLPISNGTLYGDSLQLEFLCSKNNCLNSLQKRILLHLFPFIWFLGKIIILLHYYSYFCTPNFYRTRIAIVQKAQNSGILGEAQEG